MSTAKPTSDPTGPIGVAEFAALLKTTLDHHFELLRPGFAVAVSGGADSLALTLLANRWARKRGSEFTALTVDHGLRRGSRAEAKRVGAWLSARGIAHQILTWRGDKPATNIQAIAREARYDLMAMWCARRGIKALMLAHHRDDQAETFVLRLLRGSGVDGLAAMAPVSNRCGLTLVRPLLNVPGARLEATCRKFDQDWVDDPSNQNDEFARIRVRRSLEELAPDGNLSERLAATASNMARAREALEWATANVLSRSVVENRNGFCLIDASNLSQAPEELGLRALARIIRSIGGKPYQPRFKTLVRLLAAFRAGRLERGRTLGGCRFTAWRDGVMVTRENRSLERLPLRPGAVEQNWDGRFSVRLKRGRAVRDRNYTVCGLGAAGLAQLKGMDTERAAGISRFTIPKPALLTLPALWNEDQLIAAPHLEFALDDAGKCFTARYEPVTTLSYT